MSDLFNGWPEDGEPMIDLIERYDASGVRDPEGRFVLFNDYKRAADEIERLREHNAEYHKDLLDESCRANDAEKRIEELESANANLSNAMEKMMLDEDGYGGELTTAKAKVAKLESALRKYGKHLPECTDEPLFCDCGLLKSIQGEGDE